MDNKGDEEDKDDVNDDGDDNDNKIIMTACTLIHTHSLTNKMLNKSPRWFIGGFKYKYYC